MLSESIQTLQDMGAEGVGPLSEARIYLSLSRLADPTAADVAALDSTLLQVQSYTLHLVLHLSHLKSISGFGRQTPAWAESMQHERDHACLD